MDARLNALEFTALDTETTGLSAALGDEIISIGAVRIASGAVLSEPTFDCLVNPHRKVSRASLRIHGISNEMVKDAPSIEDVLPALRDFCGDRVLVGHHVDFDLQFLRLKERRSGVRFDQPALDTLLLSAIVFPRESDHTLEAIAGRLGLSIAGRHTALGDARLAAEIFVRLVPLLEQRGVTTLAAALARVRRMGHARIAF